MKNKTTIPENKEPFDPDKAFEKMTELVSEVYQLGFSKDKDAYKKMGDINKEVNRLEKLIKEYYKKETEEFKKKQKETKQE